MNALGAIYIAGFVTTFAVKRALMKAGYYGPTDPEDFGDAVELGLLCIIGAALWPIWVGGLTLALPLALAMGWKPWSK